MTRLLVLLVCLLAVLLPMRFRILLSEGLGWMLQIGYWIAFRVTRFILRQLQD
jgi:lauroyl/myristoyl acyltransferase